MLAAALSVVLMPALTHAATIEELQAEIAQHNEEYAQATERVEELDGLIAVNEERLAEIEAALPGQRDKAAESLRTLYRMHQDAPGLVDLVLSAENFFDFLSTLKYLDIIQSRNTQAVNDLVAMVNELSAVRTELNAERAEVQVQQQTAADALAEAVAARDELEREAALAAEREAQERARYLAEAAEQAGQTFNTASGQTAVVEVPTIVEAPAETNAASEQGQTTPEPVQEQEATPEPTPAPEPEPEPEPEPAPAQNSRDQFVSVWTGRIDAYLAGSPLAGYGYAFAEAAWDYGVDPRWSPAISAIESTKGRYCFASHNAWGWGSASWPDWDTAIRSHVRGLANGYGYTITPAGAARYCPPGPAWYSAVLAQMYAVWSTDSL